MKNLTYKIILTGLVAAIVVLGALLASLLFSLKLVENIVMSWVLTVFYSLFVFYLFDSNQIKQVEITKTIAVEKPVYIEKPVEVIKQVPIQIPIENKTIEVVEVPGKTVYLNKPVTKIVYKEKRRKKLNISKYKYLGSIKTKNFHKKTCRLGRLIKRKFKIQSNSQAFFKRKHFKACKTCIKR